MTPRDAAPALVWDWNGTLLDDTSSCVGALCAMLARRGLPPVSHGFFRDNFAFPARGFYERLGMAIPNEEWDAVALEYHREYLARPAGLAADAIAALEAAERAGFAQFLFSALRQDLLDEAVEKFGIGRFFRRVAGSDNLDGAGKLEMAHGFAASLADGGFRPVALVGDSLHDAEVARAIGAACILYGGGSHSPRRLASAGPVAASLEEAVAMASERI